MCRMPCRIAARTATWTSAPLDLKVPSPTFGSLTPLLRTRSASILSIAATSHMRANATALAQGLLNFTGARPMIEIPYGKRCMLSNEQLGSFLRKPAEGKCAARTECDNALGLVRSTAGKFVRNVRFHCSYSRALELRVRSGRPSATYAYRAP